MLVLHRIGTVATAIALAGAGLPLAAGATAQEPLLRTDSGTESRYVVLFEPTTAHTEAAEEIDDQCGTMGRYHPEVDVAVADSAEEAFERVGPQRGLQRRTRALRRR